VAAAAPRLGALLRRAPTIQMLATSRRALRIAGEQVWPLAPLEAPAVDAGPDAITTSPAVELFVRRAEASDPAFVLDATNVEAVAELCRRLDGLPLAIELAAARVRLLSPAALLRRMDEASGPVLVGGHDRPERHRTLAATIDWSFRSLEPAEQAVFARLGVFVGGATLDAIEAVTDVERSGGTLDAIATLLDHGLLVPPDHGDDVRFGMLETVRATALDRLRARGELTAMRRRHLDVYCALADEAQPYLCGPDQVSWLRRIDPERANLRTAAATALELGEFGAVVELAWDLYIYYQLRGAYQEPADWVRLAAEHPDHLDERQRAVVTTAQAIAELSGGTPDVPGVEAALRQALATFERADATFEAAVAWMHLGLCALERGDPTAAIAAGQAAVDGYAEVAHDWGVGSSLNLLGVALAAERRPAEARAAHERALAAGRRIDNPMISAQALTVLASQPHELSDSWVFA
jgi:predicted ATPase